MKKENFIADVKQAIQVALFKHKAMSHVATDKNKNMSAVLIIAIGGLAWILGMKFGLGISPSVLSAIGMIVKHVILTIIGIYILSVIAKSVFKGHAKHDAYFRVLAFGMVVAWLNIFPPLSLIAGLWGLALVFVTLKVVHKLTTGGALGAIIVTVLAMGLLHMLLAPTFASLGLGNDLRTFNGGGLGEFNMKINTDEGTGSVKMDDGKMTITGPEGEVMEIEIPGS